MVGQPTYLLIYTGGAEKEFYRMVSRAISKETGPCGRPSVQDDGTIEYPQGDPKDIPGYDRIGPRSFRPNWPTCRWRTFTVTAPDGELVIEAKCQYPLATCHRKQVMPSDCKECNCREPIRK